jgi:hypothetical protein
MYSVYILGLHTAYSVYVLGLRTAYSVCVLALADLTDHDPADHVTLGIFD